MFMVGKKLLVLLLRPENLPHQFYINNLLNYTLSLPLRTLKDYSLMSLSTNNFAIV